MSSTGQIIGGVIGGIVGFFAGNPILGASIGMAIGGAIDPPKGPDIVGPRIDDLSVQTSTYGAPIARAYGTVSVIGNIFWLENDSLKEATTTEEQGGKGGSSQEATTYSYYATFAVGLLDVPDGATVSLRRLWIDTDLVYETGSDNISSTMASADYFYGTLPAPYVSFTELGLDSSTSLANNRGFIFYSGSDNQVPNARMQADKGIANVSSYPGLCYIVFEDLALEKYSNTLLRAQVKAELVIGTTPISQTDYTIEKPELEGDQLGYMVSAPNGVSYGQIEYDNWYVVPIAAHFYDVIFGDRTKEYVSIPSEGLLGGTRAYFNGVVTWTNAPILFSKEIVGSDSRMIVYTPNGQIFSSIISNSIHPALGAFSVAYDKDDGYYMVSHYGTPSKISFIEELGLFGVTKQSSISLSSNQLGLSQNYVFALAYNPSLATTTIYRFNRADLSLNATWTQSLITQMASLQIIDDNTLYVGYAGNAYRWENGVVVKTLYNIVSPLQGIESWPCFATIFSEEPPVAVSHSSVKSFNQLVPWSIAHEVINADVAYLRDIVTAECKIAGIASSDLDLTRLTNHIVRGYKITARSSIRAALEPLQAAYPFDVASSGYKLIFVSRGASSSGTIPSIDLGSNANSVDTSTVLLPISREMESQLPYRVNLKYIDASRDYDTAEQYSERPCNSINERTLDLAIVLTADEAVQKADVLLEKEWVERIDYGPFQLPPTWNHLEATDIVNIQHKGQQREVRITKIEYLPDGRVQCYAKATQASSYISTAQGSEPLVLGQSIVPLRGSTSAYILDIPRIVDTQELNGISFGLTGLADGWPGATLLRSNDGGNSYVSVGSTNNRTRLFSAGTPIGTHDGLSIDKKSILTVVPYYTGHALYSITEYNLLAHNNLAAYGIDGRWEIIAFKTAIDSSGTYVLSEFLRGLYGSEWATGLHQTGDLLVMLDNTTVGFAGAPSEQLGSQKLYRAVTQGSPLDTSPDIPYTYYGTNIKPVNSIRIRGHRTWEGTWNLEWTRRSRQAVEYTSGIDTPIGETSQLYEADIYSSASFSTIVRTITNLSSPSLSYTIAEQLNDFGAEQSTIYIDIFQMSSIVGRGFASRNTITQNKQKIPAICQYHFDGTNGSTSIISEEGLVPTNYGPTSLSTTNPKFGTSSLFIPDISGYYLVNQFTATLGTGDYCIRWWEYSTIANYSRFHLCGSLISGGNGTSSGIGLQRSGTQYRLYANGQNVYLANAPTEVLNTWKHCAVERYNGVVSVYYDGVPHATTFNDTGNYNGTYYMHIGTMEQSYNNFRAGKLDDFQFLPLAMYKGSAYTPPTTAFN